MRLAFADAVNLTEIDISVNSFGQVAPNAIPPDSPPTGSYNTSNVPRYRLQS